MYDFISNKLSEYTKHILTKWQNTTKYNKIQQKKHQYFQIKNLLPNFSYIRKWTFLNCPKLSILNYEELLKTKKKYFYGNKVFTH